VFQLEQVSRIHAEQGSGVVTLRWAASEVETQISPLCMFRGLIATVMAPPVKTTITPIAASTTGVKLWKLLHAQQVCP